MSLAMENNRCCVVIVVYKEQLNSREEKSFKRGLQIFGGKRDIFLLAPNKLSTSYYEKFHGITKIIKVNNSWFTSIAAYNRTLCSKEFYGLFKDYDYILIYQTDCWVFEDKLDEFMKLGYDWYGAPWPHLNNRVGNGGFSLRSVPKMLELTGKYGYGNEPLRYKNEDTWFCLKHAKDMKICPFDVACQFALENYNSSYKKFFESCPMGLHGKYTMDLWVEEKDWHLPSPNAHG